MEFVLFYILFSLNTSNIYSCESFVPKSWVVIPRLYRRCRCNKEAYDPALKFFQMKVFGSVDYIGSLLHKFSRFEHFYLEVS